MQYIQGLPPELAAAMLTPKVPDMSPLTQLAANMQKQRLMDRDFALQQQRMGMEQQRLGFEEQRLGFDRQRAEQEMRLAPLRLDVERTRLDQARDELGFKRQHFPLLLASERERLGAMRDETAFKREMYPLDIATRRKALDNLKFGSFKEGEVPYVQDPTQPGGVRFLDVPEPARRKLTPTEQKEAFEADDAVMQTQLALNDLKKIIQLSEKAYDGTLARERAMLMNRVPYKMGQTPEAVSTEQLHNLITNQALTSLKTIFGAAPTEGERKILLEIQGGVNQPAAVRKEIFARASELAQIRLSYNRQKAAAIRSGNYLKPDFEMKVPEPPAVTAPTQIPTITNPADAKKLQKGQRFIYNGTEYEVQ